MLLFLLEGGGGGLSFGEAGLLGLAGERLGLSDSFGFLLLLFVLALGSRLRAAAICRSEGWVSELLLLVLASLIRVEKFLDELFLVHLLDELEQRAADDILSLMNAIEAGLVESDQELDGLLVPGVGRIEVVLGEVLLFGLALGLHEVFEFDFGQLNFQTLFYDLGQLVLLYHLLSLL